MLEVAQLQHFHTRPRLNWTAKADVVNERSVGVVVGTMVAPYPRTCREREHVHAKHDVRINVHQSLHKR